ncbi:NACHT domain-containing NTPase [Halomicronema sp. CCY15110]|uniref:NACHT domain-containing protein n=1 Tax=Halomicronema sp. CCY15110 TaxID=2767773 RepID=UPI0019508136|nr:pentapeptide repeat-containing protein [Halomicronema sp. CCY15110]
MQALKGFWQFLNTDVHDIPWGELAENGIEAVVATNDFGTTVRDQAPNLKRLQPHLQQIEPFLQTLESPVTQLAVSGLPFVSIGIGLLRIYLDLSKIDPTYESAVAITAQLAYLQSLETVLARVDDATVQAQLGQVSLQTLIERQLARLQTDLTKREAETVTSRFRESVLAEQFSLALRDCLQQAELDDATTQRLVAQVTWGTHRYLHRAIAEAGDSVAPLAAVYRTGGQATQDRYDSIETYLAETIARLPNEQVFYEANPRVTYQDLYVELDVQPLTQSGAVDRDAERINIHAWAQQLLEQADQPPEQPRQVMFIEGEAGRGKSVFCRMLADRVRRELAFAYIPILIRLRNLRELANNLTETLEDCPDLEQVSFVRGDSDWLADRNTRFLLILDGFDELLLEGRASGGLKEFLQQVADFQARSHHQCVVTGRPLALQGIDRLITQTKNLARVRLEPMGDTQREQWLTKWQARFGEAETTAFRAFLQACPQDIDETLAREPLLLYLLGRLHREGQLTKEMFAGTAAQPSSPTAAKVCIYRESVNWVLDKQRQDENLRLAGLEELDDLREVLQEAALCVVQSGNETAQVAMLKQRFQDTANPVKQYLEQSQATTGQSDEKALNNLLTTFYLKPKEGERGSVEFAHKSFGEYLFAERLICAFTDWTELKKRQRLVMDEGAVNAQIYDLLGYGGLSVEIVDYLFELLSESDIDRVQLFERLHGFYQRWHESEFLNQGPVDDLPQQENLPLKKMLQLRNQGIAIGLKQVDVFAGLNVLILLFKLHAQAQPESYPTLPNDAPAPAITFHPCGTPGTENWDKDRLLNTIHYADSLGFATFTLTAGPHLARANFERANLLLANLQYAILLNANFERANLERTILLDANLARANLVSANLERANLERAILLNANLERAYLFSANLARAILLDANLGNARNLSSAQFSGVSPPLLCGVTLPADLALAPNRDCGQLPQALADSYPSRFESVEVAVEFVRQQVPSWPGENLT